MMLSKENIMYTNVSQNENMDEIDAIMLERKKAYLKRYVEKMDLREVNGV